MTLASSRRQWTVDAFASGPFLGNPACVVEPLDAWPSDVWMQALAQENNQSETAFLLRTSEPRRFGLRWFTPALEVALCGHATLAAGHVLFSELCLDAPSIAFETRLRGTLTVSRIGSGYAMNFPSDPPRQTRVPEGLAEALGVEPTEVWAGTYLVAILAEEAQLHGLKPDIALLGQIAGEATGGPGHVAVAALAGAGAAVDVVDRFFAPGSGISEDPATGSAHCILAPLYAQKLGRPNVRFRQAFPGRGADFETLVRGDRVVLSGCAVTTIESRLLAADPAAAR